MDLAEIRKKARNDKESAGRKPAGLAEAPPPRPRPAAPGFPAEPAERPAAAPPAAAADPLERLFSFQADAAAATEEAYEQSLLARSGRQEEDLRQWLTFPLGSEEYALDIASIREIIKLREITEVPRVPDFVLGIISLRGIVIPVFDLKKRLRLGAIELDPACRIIVCQHGEKVGGLLVEGITQVVRLPAGKIEPPPGILSGVDRELVEGVGRCQGRMTILLDLACVLDSGLS